MQKPATPINEAQRLKSLHALGILDTVPDAAFDRHTQLAARSLNVPIAVVSLLDRDRQWFKSSHGLAVSETSRDVSFCGHAILADDPFVVGDASTDARFHDNPLVAGAAGIRFYAGQPLHAPDGQRIGVLCVIDHKPREFSAQDRRLLADIAGRVEAVLAQLAVATTDPLTQLANLRGFESRVRHELRWCQGRSKPACLGVIRIEGVKEFCDRFGETALEAVLRPFSELLRDSFRPSDVLAHCAPGEFRFFTPGRGEEEILKVLDQLAVRAGGAVSGSLYPGPIWHSGIAGIESARAEALPRLVERAVQRLEDCKVQQSAFQAVIRESSARFDWFSSP